MTGLRFDPALPWAAVAAIAAVALLAAAWALWRGLPGWALRGLAGLAAAAHTLFRGKVDNAGWWAQTAAVAYEQQIGRRVPGQLGDGTFQVSVSKTVPGSRRDSGSSVCSWTVTSPRSAWGLPMRATT